MNCKLSNEGQLLFSAIMADWLAATAACFWGLHYENVENVALSI